jgi:hypothetical protein
MADIISAGQRETTVKTVRDNDTGTIESGGRLEAFLIWQGGSASPGVIIDNSARSSRQNVQGRIAFPLLCVRPPRQ